MNNPRGRKTMPHLINPHSYTEDSEDARPISIPNSRITVNGSEIYHMYKPHIAGFWGLENRRNMSGGSLYIDYAEKSPWVVPREPYLKIKYVCKYFN